MSKWIAFAFLALLSAATARAQVPCSQCGPQAVECRRQADAAFENCNRPYWDNYQRCMTDANEVRWTCWDYCNSVYCYQCDWQFDWYASMCDQQYRLEITYCQNAQWTWHQGCQNQFDDCQANCSYSFASYLSKAFGGTGADAGPPLAARADCASASAPQARPTAWRLAMKRAKTLPPRVRLGFR